MNDRPAIIFVTAMIFIYDLSSKAADRSPVAAPMVFVAAGILVDPAGFDLFSMEAHGERVHILTETTLILILFVDASTINLASLIKDRVILMQLSKVTNAFSPSSC
ncbi:MAG: hypothetical protein GY935_20265 [Gammaproteobacteria bacterium]|nr:hypothetical protein [Gammaproteobacteria bacterium]